MRTCDVCRSEIEIYLSNPCPNCAAAVDRLANYVEWAPDVDWTALKAAVLQALAKREWETRQGLTRYVDQARRQMEELRAKREALERQDLKCAL